MVAGAASGFLVASVFVSAGVLMLFEFVKDPSPASQAIFGKYPPQRFVLPVVIAAFPTWGLIGAIMGLLYEISTQQVPGSGLGSPNMVFTIAVLVATLLLAAPLAILLRRVLAGFVAIVAAVIGVFGWFLPFFVG